MDAIDHAAAVLQGFDIEPRPLDRHLDAYFRRHREVGSVLRRCVSEAAFGVMRWRRRLDGWLMMQDIRAPYHRARILSYLLWKRPETAAIVPFEGMACAMGIDAAMPETMPARFPGGVAAFVSFPDFLYDALAKMHGDAGVAELALALNEPATPVLRVNTLRGDRDDVRRQLQEAGIASQSTPHSPFGLVLEKRAAIDQTAAFRKGAAEFQDEASQLAVICADPKPGELVFDACAGAGGKSLLLAMLMGNRGRIIAADPVEAKLSELDRRARRAGVAIIETISAGKLRKRCDLKGAFDLVFIDAPCSGTGTLRRSPDLKWRLSPEIIDERIALQKELLSEFCDWIKPGGRIVYVTCSLLVRENEQVAEWIQEKKRLARVDVSAALSAYGVSTEGVVTKEGYFRTDPRQGNWDGFFAAVFQK